jgi:hypothetical protein
MHRRDLQGIVEWCSHWQRHGFRFSAPLRPRRFCAFHAVERERKLRQRDLGRHPGQRIDRRDASTVATIQNTDTTANAVLKVFFKDEGISENNITKARIYVENAGMVDAKNFVFYYYFTTEGGKTPVLEDYYTPDSEVSLVSLGSGRYAIKYYFASTLDPGATSNPGGEQVGVHYGDWSVMDRSNDESNPGGSGWIVSDTIPAIVEYPLPTNYSYKGAEPNDSELGDLES